MTDNYKLVNQIKKERHLAAIRSDILAAESQQALDAILGSPTPAALVQSFPDQDLHFLMHTIGPHDFLPALALASFDQWEYLLDIETWEGDRVDMPMVTQMLSLLFAADPERLVRWMILEKTEFFELYLFKNMEVRLLEENEDPSDFPDDFQTIDNLFYVRFPEIPQQILDQDGGAEVEQARARAETLIMAMLNKVADMDLSVSHALLLETGTVIPAEVEEEELRLKVFRLAEKGFLPHHEAVGIYQPKDVDSLVPRPVKELKKTLYGGDYPLPPLYFSSLVGADNLFARSLTAVNETALLNLQAELSGLVNRLSSADGGVVRERQDLERLVQKGCAFLSLGMEVIHGDLSDCTPREGAAIIARYHLADIFRVASRACLTLKTRAKGWYDQSWLAKNDLPLHFFGEQWLGVLGGLLLDRPLFFDNYQTGVLYRPFGSVGEIAATDKALGQIIAIDGVMAGLDPDLTGIAQASLTFKPIIFTLWARDRLGLDVMFKPIERSVFLPFFVELFSGEKPGTIDEFKRDDFTGWIAQATGIDQDRLTRDLGDWVTEMFDQLGKEYGAVAADDLESRFVTDFFLKG
ncbi:putative metal-dependent hydrolase of the beta-lactamase superfamily [Desulforapulum autotrophicum HRM2]|uniref:Metal-dependent hydrolase of the beta-lactamase superfamily n=1 Tax=Desulforapulum autotrophicum (strain ATCC 43914 / DSM 3382 / VKM B-1955 / HRM2) TaxID=177437 RepID=C0QAM0_DESAH|nr:DUF6178 family protein [Desulforapulum autotrophicum]ACN16803.1 putative metal-dependent hydrolase of the beta-lactamase superfamily [Desulforapulum autotrophicum HRM2]